MSTYLVSPLRPHGMRVVVSALLLLSCVSTAQAQVFKWVGPDGKVNYGDSPPANLRAEKKSLTANVLDDASMPFAVTEAVRLHPVTLYAGTACVPCDAGRKHLEARGIPFTEKSVTTNADIALLGGSRAELPQLAIGRDKLTGFEAGAWDSRLSAAGYPASSKLSRSYRNPPPSALAPASAEATGRRQADDGAESQTPAGAAVQAPKVQPRPPGPARSDTNASGLRF